LRLLLHTLAQGAPPLHTWRVTPGDKAVAESMANEPRQNCAQEEKLYVGSLRAALVLDHRRDERL